MFRLHTARRQPRATRMRALLLALAPLAALAALLGPGAPRAAVAGEDPRPTILILGNTNTEPFGGDPSWAQRLRSDHPDWNLRVRTTSKGTLSEILENAEGWLAHEGRVDAVLIFTGTHEVESKHWEQADAAARKAEMEKLLALIKASDAGKEATIAVLTPMPVIDARLDKWAKKKYGETGAEARSAELAQAFTEAAEAAGVLVIDVHGWQMQDRDQHKDGSKGKTGRLLGSNGFVMRGWGHPIFHRWIAPRIVETVKPTSGDPEGFERWKAEQAALAKLTTILHETAAGTVNHGPALKAEVKKDKRGVVQEVKATVPAALLSGETLDLLVRAPAGKLACFIPTSENKGQGPLLTVEAIHIRAPGSAWKVLSEAQPEQGVGARRFSINIGKMRYRPAMREKAGERYWCLLRFPLEALAGRTGKEPVDGVITLKLGQIQQLKGEYGAPEVYPIRAPDKAWTANATWATRDGTLGWTGGEVETAKRKAALEAFLATNPPEAIAAMAKAYLDESP